MTLEIASTLRSRLVGLRGRDGFGGVLMLTPCNDIHTLGMRRPIDVAFVSPAGAVLEAHRDVGPRRRLRNAGAAATLERFACDGPWYRAGDLIQHGTRLVLDPSDVRKGESQ